MPFFQKAFSHSGSLWSQLPITSLPLHLLKYHLECSYFLVLMLNLKVLLLMLAFCFCLLETQAIIQD